MRKRNVKISKKCCLKIGELALPVGTRINIARISRQSRKIFATGDNHNNIVVWALNDGQPVMTMNSQAAQQSEVAALCFCNGEAEMISGSSRGTINIWDLSKKKSTPLKGHPTSVTSFTTFLSDDNKLASGSYDTYIKLWDIRSKDNTAILKGHNKQITSLDVSPDGMMLLSGSEDSTIKLWDLRYPQRIIVTYTEHTGPVNVVKFNPEDITFASGSSDRTAKYFRCEPNHYVYYSSTQPLASPVTAIQFSDDGRILYTAANDSLKLWNMNKQGILMETIESSWKGVQDICLIQGILTAVSWTTAGLAVWAEFQTSMVMHQQPQQKFSLPAINPNRFEDLKVVNDQLLQIEDRIKDIENLKQKKESKKQMDSPMQNRSKKENFMQQMLKQKEREVKKKLQEDRKREQQEKLQQAELQKIRQEKKKKLEEQRLKKLQEQKLKKEQERLKKEEEKAAKQRQKRQREEQLARQAQQERQNHELQLQRFNECMAKQQKKKFQQANYMLESVLEEKLDDSLKMSAFMGDNMQKEKFKQYDLISDILKEDLKFTSVMAARKQMIKPILTWWGQNNVKNALYALNECEASIAADAIQAIVTTPKYKGYITPDVALPLVRKSAELMMQKNYRYVKNGIFNINQIAMMYKDQLIKLKTFNPMNRVDLSREERMAKYDRLIDVFGNVFRMERLKKYAKEDQSQELNQLAAQLYKNLEEILRKCLPKNEGQMVPS